jgi:hypothetical protein
MVSVRVAVTVGVGGADVGVTANATVSTVRKV